MAIVYCVPRLSTSYGVNVAILSKPLLISFFYLRDSGKIVLSKKNIFPDSWKFEQIVLVLRRANLLQINIRNNRNIAIFSSNNP